jgi:hypothetical protein
VFEQHKKRDGRKPEQQRGKVSLWQRGNDMDDAHKEISRHALEPKQLR